MGEMLAIYVGGIVLALGLGVAMEHKGIKGVIAVGLIEMILVLLVCGMFSIASNQDTDTENPNELPISTELEKDNLVEETEPDVLIIYVPIKR